jgi:hypothetical protein
LQNWKKEILKINLENFTSTAFKFFVLKLQNWKKKFAIRNYLENFTSTVLNFKRLKLKEKFCKEINLENFTSLKLISSTAFTF